MPPLSNQRREGFCRAIVRGESASGAYAGIYHVSGRTAEVNGSKLLRNTAVSERIAELQGTAAQRTVKTVESLVADLDATIAFARECKNPAAMVAAINAQARLLGLVVDRSEVIVMNKPAPLPTKILELSEEEWTAQFSTGTGPRPSLTDRAKQRKAETLKSNGASNRGAIEPTITWDVETNAIKARGVIGLDDDD
ncbi:Terminase small subunit [Rhizobium leguminosarum]|nr:Terminase small subunit [Rhizobium ruizarguesonis]TBF85390.1 Terminase small subunit [Rhizobium leguminosarum]TBH04843.1 Terminase small subunit [Rhizobium leguminosarum]TBH69526.1 Terminase small subunit [Rhizobium leguminosarum]